MKSVGLLVIAMLFLCGTAQAERTVWYVHPDSALNTIQAGLDSCVENDIVLVGPGTYYENIVWPNTQGIHLVSESGPEVTIINGGSIGRVVEITSGVDLTTMIRGFTIQNGNADQGAGVYCNNSSPNLEDVTLTANSASDDGGGICCRNNSTPHLEDVTIISNSAGDGGGIYCGNSSPSLTAVSISGNYAHWNGGGIYCRNNSSPSLENVAVSGNTAEWGSGGGGIVCIDNSDLSLINVTISENTGFCGGGIVCFNSSPSFDHCTISGNSAGHDGGGIRCDSSDISLSDVTISGNTANSYGGGIYSLNYSSLNFENVTICGNIASGNASYGGGIYCQESNPNFDSVNRCNIYLNYAGAGCDLYAQDCNIIDVIVDTFAAFQPDHYFAYPIDNFTFDILHTKVQQVNQDLYVSPDGNDNNGGLSAGDPLLTVSCALTKILADSANPLTIHLSSGVYSPSQTGERFPLNCRSYVSLLGEDEAWTLLDGEKSSGILLCMNDNDFSIENMTIRNGTAAQGGGIYCDNSSPSLSNVAIIGNNVQSGGQGQGGGIFCFSSSPDLTNVTISGNSANGWIGGNGAGVYCDNSSPSLTNVIITENVTDYFPQFGHVGSGISCQGNSSPSLINVTISENTTDDSGGGGGVYCSGSSADLLNCILWNNTPQEICVQSGFLIANYSDIQGGWSGVGNIDVDPIFVNGPLSDYHLSLNSSCIDAGNPNPQYNDPEDPLNPGYALWPALGTVRNDMGAYGGPVTSGWVGIEENTIRPMLDATRLLEIYPNPFRHSTDIRYQITDDSKDLVMSIYDVAGRKVRDLTGLISLIGHQSSVKWDGTDQANRQLGNGVYFITLQTGNVVVEEKVLLIR